METRRVNEAVAALGEREPSPVQKEMGNENDNDNDNDNDGTDYL